MPYIYTRLELSSDLKSSGNNNSARFSNIPWNQIIPVHTKKTRVRASLYIAPQDYRDTTDGNHHKYVATCKLNIPAARVSLNAIGNVDYTFQRCVRDQSNTTQTPTAHTSYFQPDTSAILYEFQGTPSGDMLVQWYGNNTNGDLELLVDSTLSGGNYIQGTDMGSWYISLFFENELYEVTQEYPNRA